MNRLISVIWFIVKVLATLSIAWLVYLIWKEKPLDMVDRSIISLLLAINILHFWQD